MLWKFARLPLLIHLYHLDDGEISVLYESVTATVHPPLPEAFCEIAKRLDCLLYSFIIPSFHTIWIEFMRFDVGAKVVPPSVVEACFSIYCFLFRKHWLIVTRTKLLEQVLIIC